MAAVLHNQPVADLAAAVVHHSLLAAGLVVAAVHHSLLVDCPAVAVLRRLPAEPAAFAAWTSAADHTR